MSHRDFRSAPSSPETEARFNPRVPDAELTVIVSLDETGADPLSLFASEYELLREKRSDAAIERFTSHEPGNCEYFTASEIKRTAPAQHRPSRWSVNARLAILAIVMIVATSYGLRELSARRPSQPIDPAVVASDSEGGTLLARLPADVIRPNERLQRAVPEVTVPRTPISAGKSTSEIDDARAIRAVVNRYRDAMSTSDVRALQAVWPRTDVNAVRREFAARVEQNLEFEACRVSRTGTRADVSCIGVIESGFRPGQRRPRLERRRWEFTLSKIGTRWIIAGLTYR